MAQSEREILNRNTPRVPAWAQRLVDDPELVKQQARLQEENSHLVSHNADAALLEFARREVGLAEINLSLDLPEENKRQERLRLAENLITLGEFNRAQKIAMLNGNTDLAERAKLYEEAILKSDNLWCKCDNPTHMVEKSGRREMVPLDRFFTLTRIQSSRHGAVVAVRQCSVCGTLNAVPDNEVNNGQK